MTYKKFHNPYIDAVKKEQKMKVMEDRQPIIKLSRLINQYHSIDKLEGTKKEKDWAKERLYEEIYEELGKLNPKIRGQFKASVKNPVIWEDVRERFCGFL